MKMPDQATPVLDQGFVHLVDMMGDDDSVVEAAKISYGNHYVDDVKKEVYEEHFKQKVLDIISFSYFDQILLADGTDYTIRQSRDCAELNKKVEAALKKQQAKNTNLLRYLMREYHTTPFEMVELKFLVRVPMDCWRQWIRHRTASVNEYSTRYKEPINAAQHTPPEGWRLQATDNKQGSKAGELEWPEGHKQELTPGEHLSTREILHIREAQDIYKERIDLGVAREQARKDLPLSTYTEAFWKCNLHNLFHFLRLRLHPHAQYEIRQYAQAIYDIIKEKLPECCQAFEDYRLNSCSFSAMEMRILRAVVEKSSYLAKSDDMSKREWNDFLAKLHLTLF